MDNPQVRKVQLSTNRIYSAGGRPLDRPHRAGSVAAVLENPFVGEFPNAEAVGEWMKALEPLALECAADLQSALAPEGDDYEIATYGKGAIVGVNGELEVGAAWHGPAGIGLRTTLGHPKAQVQSSKKIGALGSQLDIPLVYLHASYLRSHYDVQPVVVPDGPRPNEVVYAMVMSTGPRPHHRIGGFTMDEVTGEDGQR